MGRIQDDAPSSAEFRDGVRQIASIDTLDGFLRELRGRYPETGSFAAPAPAADAPAAAPGSVTAPGNASLRRPGAADATVAPAAAIALSP
jgi:hypothetical protein